MEPNKPGLWQILKNAKSMQDNMQKARKDLVDTKFKGQSGPVTLYLTGDHRIDPITITCDDANLDQKALLAAMAEAWNDAVSQIEQASRTQVQNMTKDMNLDGMFNNDDQDER